MEIEIVNGAAAAHKLRSHDVFRYANPKRNITDLVAESMGHKSNNAAKNIGINPEAVRYIRKMIIISKHHMEVEDRAKLQYCFDKLNAERSLIHVRLAANPIIKKYWVKSKPRKESRKTEIKRFEHALFALHEVCQTAADLDIPFGYSTEQVRSAWSKVDQARKALVYLKSKLEGRTPKESPNE